MTRSSTALGCKDICTFQKCMTRCTQILNYKTSLIFNIILGFNPIPAGVLENQEIPCLMSKHDKWYIIGKLLCSTFRICKKKLQICKNWTFFCKIQFYSKNVCKKKIVQKIKNYTFLKSPWPCHFKYAKNFAKFLTTWCVIKKN